MKYINRIIEKKLKEYCKMFPVVAVVGPRQIGKSTTLKKIFLKKYMYISMDDLETRIKASDNPKEFILNLDDFCIIDEAQYCPEIFSYIKLKVDSDPSIKGRFILSGSQNFLLMKNISESLAGRVGILNMSVFSSEEIKYINKNIDENNKFYLFCLRGAYPEPLLNKKIKVDNWYSSYMATYIQRDIRILYNIGKLLEFEKFIKMLADQAGQLLNLSRIANNIGVAVNTLKEWLSILQASGIIYILNPYFSNLYSRFIKSPKIFFVDTGLLCFLNEIKTKNILKNNPKLGSIFENFIIMETLKFLENRGLNKKLFFLRTQNGFEIDLLLEIGNKIYPVEIKISNKFIGNAIKNIEKLIIDYKKIPAERGYVLTLSGNYTDVSPFTVVLNFNDYFKELIRLYKI